MNSVSQYEVEVHSFYSYNKTKVTLRMLNFEKEDNESLPR